MTIFTCSASSNHKIHKQTKYCSTTNIFPPPPKITCYTHTYTHTPPPHTTTHPHTHNTSRGNPPSSTQLAEHLKQLTQQLHSCQERLDQLSQSVRQNYSHWNAIWLKSVAVEESPSQPGTLWAVTMTIYTTCGICGSNQSRPINASSACGLL